MSRDSTKKVLSVALLLCLVCSVLVSSAAVLLSERQERNKIEEKRKNILQAAGLYKQGEPIADLYAQIAPRIVDLQSGWFSDRFDPVTFDSRAAAKDPTLNQEIPAPLDLADIKRRSLYKEVYLVLESGQLQQLILPVHGKGLWSTMYGFISLADDLTTVRGFSFYEHGETPGLGGEIDNPNWKNQWQGKRIYGENGELRIEVAKGTVDKNDPNAVYKADGLAGSTLTARGVDNLLKYWLGEDGYQPFLERLQQQGLEP
ncbi:MAG: Na(+)-translocating NADH-quinone reductase subunit C [Deltaproteobacteria bacterium]|nr:Na(+)-translocating NADH-quinone reductase subunit C [Deltaproteobacteria bacterium]MCW8893566.1 Na(+)-translocating NADH-quinone reductase subunit C [Deltaproteobacteria bacterium]